MAENKKRVNYLLNYAKTHYKRVPLDLPIDKYNELKAAADNSGYTVNGYIKQAIDDKLNKSKQLE